MNLAAERSYPTPLANLALLPMLLMSLTKQKHSPDTAKSFKKEYDYIIVGSGSAGSVVANRLSEIPCVSVLLLEAGKPPPLLTDVPAISRFFLGTDLDWQFMTVPQKHTGRLLKNRQVPMPSGKVLGGSSVINDMQYARGNRKNYDDWEAEGATGWSFKDVLPYFKKMEDNRDPEYVANGYHGVGGLQTVHRPRYQPEMKDPLFRAATSMGYEVVDPNARRQTGFYDLQANLRYSQRCSVAKSYLVPAENRTNLDILPRARALKVLIKNHRAVGVRMRFHGQVYEVKAKREVILSAGTINSAKLLMLSGIGPRKELQRLKIPVIADLPVGKNLQDHAASFLHFELKPSIEPLLSKLSNPANAAQYIHNRTGILASAGVWNTIAFLKNRAIRPKIDFPDHELIFSEAASVFGEQIGLIPEAQRKIYGPYVNKPFWNCYVHLLHPYSKGKVTLRSSDPYDDPIIDPNYLADPRDVEDLVEGLKACNRISDNPHMRKIGSRPFRTLIPGCEKYVHEEDTYLRCLVRSIITTPLHQVGTVRMGHPKDHRTVVDPKLRVKNIKGLRVVDASIMPIVPSGNINIPVMMIAEKGSDIIKSDIKCHSHYPEDDEWSEEGDDTQWNDDDDEKEYPDFDTPDHSKELWDNDDNKWDDETPTRGYYPLDKNKWSDTSNQEHNQWENSPTRGYPSADKNKWTDVPIQEHISVDDNKWEDIPTRGYPSADNSKWSDVPIPEHLLVEDNKWDDIPKGGYSIHGKKLDEIRIEGYRSGDEKWDHVPGKGHLLHDKKNWDDIPVQGYLVSVGSEQSKKCFPWNGEHCNRSYKSYISVKK